MRPIVSFCGSPTYQLSKYLTTILQPLTDKSRRKLQSTEDFINATKTVQIPDDYKLMSFDVKSLFTSIPLQLALQCTETAILQSTINFFLKTTTTKTFSNVTLTDLLLLPKQTTTQTPTTTATILYIKGISENISRILQTFDIRIAHKPITTLRQLLTNVKDEDEPRNR